MALWYKFELQHFCSPQLSTFRYFPVVKNGLKETFISKEEFVVVKPIKTDFSGSLMLFSELEIAQFSPLSE